jgi:hypothetical protein
MKTSKSVTNIIKARIKAKSEMRKPRKDGINPHFKSKYTTYEELILCVEEALIKNELDMVLEVLNKEDKVGCQITLYHSSGEFIGSDPFYIPSTQTAQGYGSSVTYVKRYCVEAFFGLASEDDDGNKATEEKKVSTKPPHDKKKYIDFLVMKCKEKGISDSELTVTIRKNFEKSGLNFMNVEELRKLYKLLE